MAQQTRTKRTRMITAVCSLTLVGGILLNAVAYMQARAMTHFVPVGVPVSAVMLAEASLFDKATMVITGVRVPRPQNVQTPTDHYLPYETHRIDLGDGDHLEGWFVPHPASHGVVIMFSGYAGIKDGLLTPAAHVHQMGYNSLLVDFRGSGGSSGNNTTLGMREADDVAAAFAYVQRHWPGQPIILYGVSMGSSAILRAVALNGIDPDALILEGVFDRLTTTTRHRFTAFGVPSFPATELLFFWGSVQTGYNGFRHNTIEYAKQVDSPVLLLYGGVDPWIRETEALAIAEQFRSNTQVVKVPDTGHEMPFVHRAPELWVTTVGAFLNTTVLSQ
ncbi:MAG: alpha/beta fold hydrolase [Chloroflexota bacterium]